MDPASLALEQLSAEWIAMLAWVQGPALYVMVGFVAVMAAIAILVEIVESPSGARLAT